MRCPSITSTCFLEAFFLVCLPVLPFLLFLMKVQDERRTRNKNISIPASPNVSARLSVRPYARLHVWNEKPTSLPTSVVAVQTKMTASNARSFSPQAGPQGMCLTTTASSLQGFGGSGGCWIVDTYLPLRPTWSKHREEGCGSDRGWRAACWPLEAFCTQHYLGFPFHTHGCVLLH